VKDFTFETCQPCHPPKRYAGCSADCPGWKYREEQNRERYAETLAAVRAIPDHAETRNARNEELRRQKNGRNPQNK
jgi:hypothetical protein